MKLRKILEDEMPGGISPDDVTEVMPKIKEWAESCVPKIDVNKINLNLSSDSEAIVKLKYAREVLKNIEEG